MKIQAILPLVTYPDANSDAVAANAVAVAAYLGADLQALTLNADIPDVSNTLSRLLLKLPELIKQAERVSRERGEHLLAKVKEEAAKQDVNLTTMAASPALAFLGEAAAAEARYFDIALLGWEASNLTSRACAEAVIFGAGRPVLLLPELTTIQTIDHVAIAWDGSRVAARAMADAAPFLVRAAKISVLTVVDEKPLREGDMGERLAAGLRKRGLAAEGFSIHAEDCPIGVSLQERAIERGAKLLAMGGYGHSRVRDFVLGGATQDVLDDLRLPVLFSH
ncbi:MAG: universal stress protein [Mesorhizobium sp.]|uniref:universal stress protein n=1 Tax=unclassified Mesorhizobium TaxID=325217 RepID=UPI000FCA40AF|nr:MULTISPECIES: universal stress protein [unclassified Mesorhizobium]RUV74829.1 universal stress protein [Mesorhizobium sp. M5C.F.Cr.IN.023.01.1.1]RWF88664.1 MAG: universal stress protein [Mesorhizobium sp.]RWF92945.1 MAG: universal stress protein [Mesorhizobium sp.]RWI41268.1 MAG: universal stress protein [Mesorhizobium sp.]RWI49739.1 MAG: universal stress protein [Mesorhizobium sp.]